MSNFETKDSGARENLANGMVRDAETDKVDYTLLLDGPLFERWAALLTRGAAKYGPRNWTKALESTDAAARATTTERFRRSAFRHMMQWLAGDRSEDHAAAVMFNMNGAEAMRAGRHWCAGATPTCETCEGTGTRCRHRETSDAEAADSAKRKVPCEPKVGDRVRVTKCDHAPDAVGVEGKIRSIDPRRENFALPYYVSLDKPSATHGHDVWCDTVEAVCP